ncbi:MAG: hypothetical protein RR014_07150 [Bilophila sp.]
MAKTKNETEETTSETVEQNTKTALKAEVTPVLETLSVLADRHRLATWEQAGILRLMGWTEDKQVTAEAYETALDVLRSRRIGGGRRG